jgi:hypothetical protein
VDPATAGLNAYFKFDEERFASLLVDSSGNGNDAAVGRIPDIRNEIFYVTDRGAQPASKPRRVASTAPVYGGTSQFYAVPGGQVLLELYSYDADLDDLTTTVVSAPTAGTLHAAGGEEDEDAAAQPQVAAGEEVVDYDPARRQSKRVWYRPGSAFGGAGDMFQYSVSDGGPAATATVVISLLNTTGMVDAADATTPEDTPIVITFGGATVDGEKVWVELLTLPENGTLYEPTFPVPPKYPLLNLLDTTHPVLADHLPYRLLDDAGALIFSPLAESSGYTLTLTLRWVMRRALSGPGTPVVSPATTVRIVVTPVNDAPQTVGSVLSVQPNETLQVGLSATDLEATFAERSQFRVVQAPKLGDLFHSYRQAAGGEVAEERMDLVTGYPMVLQYASGLAPYEPKWGVSWTSQFDSGQCGDCCVFQETCNYPAGDCGLECSPNRFGWAEKVIGEPRASLDGGSQWDAWRPSSASTSRPDGVEFITVEYSFQVFISALTVFESHGPGAIVRILAAQSYAGNETEWGLLWEGPTEPEVQAAGISRREFSPPICKDSRAHARYIRVELRTGDITGHNNIDSIRIQGSQQAPKGMVLSGDGAVGYRVTDGFHGERLTCPICRDLPFDSFSVVASDCVTEQETPTVFEVVAAAPARAGVAPVVQSLARSIGYVVGSGGVSASLSSAATGALFESVYGPVLHNCSRNVQVAVIGGEADMVRALVA